VPAQCTALVHYDLSLDPFLKDVRKRTVSIRQHTSAYVSIAYVSYVSMRKRTEARTVLKQSERQAETAMPDCFEIPRVVPPLLLLLFLNVKHLLQDQDNHCPPLDSGTISIDEMFGFGRHSDVVQVMWP
jgi:hypothetical protein